MPSEAVAQIWVKSPAASPDHCSPTTRQFKLIRNRRPSDGKPPPGRICRSSLMPTYRNQAAVLSSSSSLKRSSRVTFVSVTQSFNTTTSMGRLTLNILLSFAQFEREVTAERIRDKIAASKKKGMWMGGAVPFGYRVEARKLVPRPEEAARVRALFERYLALGTVPKLQVELERGGQRSPVRVSADGKRSGGAVFSRGNLYALLTNPLVIGRVRHKDQVYAGQPPAIVETALWDQVQTRLTANRVTRSDQPTGDITSPLAGRLFDPDGNPMRPSHANNGKRRYRYYVSRDLIEKTVGAGAKGWRIPAAEIEAVLARAVVARIEDPAFVSAALGHGDGDPSLGARAIAALRGIAADLRAPGTASGRATLRRVTRRIDLGEHRLRAEIDLGAERTIDGADGLAGITHLNLDQPIAVKRRGKALRLVLAGASAERSSPDAPGMASIPATSRA
ncbi:recombinase family protein [uncultured Amaricoccus sp.]|uniref:recombinase family protein n=1 Tax=uncultured Amaricoccus sp. TaxID=339341 RepID=UPI003457FEB6